MGVMAELSCQSVMSSVQYQMIPDSTDHETVFNIVNYAQPVQDEIDEGYSTNYSPSSKSTSSFECDTSFERQEPSSSDIQYVTGQIGERIDDGKGNMMWLVDFKLDFLNDIEKSGADKRPAAEFEVSEPAKRMKVCEVQDSFVDDNQDSPLNLSHISPAPVLSPSSVLSSAPSSVVSCPSSGGNKPNYTYTDLITLALRDKTALTVSGIYQWITDNYPYYKAEDDRWKNSVRHNLSMNPNFRKGGRAKQGTGHVWVLADVSDLRPQESLSENSSGRKDSSDEAIRKILQSSFPKSAASVPVKKRSAAKRHQPPSSAASSSLPVTQAPVRMVQVAPPPPPPSYTVVSSAPMYDIQGAYPVQVGVAPPPYTPPAPQAHTQYLTVDYQQQQQQQQQQHQNQYDFSVSDSDR